MHTKHLKHMNYTLQHALATSKEGREREVQPEKAAPGLATPVVMSRAEVECHGSAGVDSGLDLLVGNGGIASTSTRRGARQACRGGDWARLDRAEWARWGMEYGVAVDVAWLNAGWGRRREVA